MFNIVRDTKRLREIVIVFARHGFGSWIEQTRLYDYYTATKKFFTRTESVSRTQAERFRFAIEDLGGTFIKLGQILSTRTDILPEDWTNELSRLQDQVPAAEFEEVESFIEEELGRPMDELFREFDKKPFAAASIGQVYNAALKDGQEVVVKVQRPGVGDLVEKDLEIIRYLAGLAEKSIPAAGDLDITGVVDEFSRSLRREMDYTLEAKNIIRFRENFRENPRIYIPEVYRELTTRRVIVIEKIKGLKIGELNEDTATRRELAREGAKAILRQVFTDGLFHADPHPGNIFVLDGNVIAFIDFGMVGRIEPQMRDDLVGLLISTVSQDVEKLARLLVKISRTKAEIDSSAFRRDLSDIMDRYYDVSLRNIPFGEALSELLVISRRYHLHIPVEYTMMLKALLTIEQTAVKLDADFNLVDEAKPFVEKLMISRYSPEKNLAALTRSLGELNEFLREFPTRARGIMAKLDEGGMSFEFRHAGLEKAVRELDRASGRISFSLVILALVVASSVMVTFAKTEPLYWIGLLGYFVSALLGMILLVGTIRGGRL